MNFRHPWLILTILISATGFGADNLKLIIPGSFHGNEVTIKDGAAVSEVYDTGGKCGIRAARLRVQRAKDKSTDIDDAASARKKVFSASSENVVFWLKGLKSSAKRSFQSHFCADQVVGNGDEIVMTFKNGNRYKISGIPYPGNDKVVQLTLSTDNLKQILSTYPLDGNNLDENTRLLWAGDIDGDGKIDVLQNKKNHYNQVANRILFLSSRAKKGELSGEAVTFRANAD